MSLIEARHRDLLPSSTALATAAGEALRRLRERRPRIHCLTNPVAQELSANLLLAVGAEPSMTSDPGAIGEFLRGSGALIVNLGMLDPERARAARAGVAAAQALELPWLLDPVKVERSAPRLAFARELLACRPAVLRGNEAEIAALAGTEPDAAAALARSRGCVVAQTGPEDRLTDGTHHLTLAYGSPLMDRVTALGCAVSALVGAFLAFERNTFEAAAAALLVAGIAGEIAAGRASGPGSFAVAFLDALYAIEPADLLARTRRP